MGQDLRTKVLFNLGFDKIRLIMKVALLVGLIDGLKGKFSSGTEF